MTQHRQITQSQLIEGYKVRREDGSIESVPYDLVVVDPATSSVTVIEPVVFRMKPAGWTSDSIPDGTQSR